MKRACLTACNTIARFATVDVIPRVLVNRVEYARRCCYALLVILVYAPAMLLSQEIPQLLQFEPSTYQAANQNWSFTQDDEGYLYVANSEGVLVHNGMGWQLVELPRNVRPRAVHYHLDRVYVVGFETLGWLDMSDRAQPAFVPMFSEIMRGSREEYWGLASLDSSLLYQSFSQVFVMPTDGPPEPLQLSSTFMLGSEGLQRDYYLPAIQGPLLRLNRESIEIDTVAPLSLIPAGARITSVIDDVDGLLVFTQFKGIFRLVNDTLRPISLPISEIIKSAQANKALRLTDGSIAVGTIQSGVIIIDQDLQIRYEIDRKSGLLNNTVLSLYQDRVGQLWIGLDNGIALLALQDEDRHYYDVAGELGTITCATTYDGALYLGSNQGLFRQSADGSFDLVEGSQGPVFHLEVIGEELVCSHNLGCYILRGRDLYRIADVVGTWDVQSLSSTELLATTYGGLQVCSRGEEGEWGISRSVRTPVLLSDISVINDTLLGYHDYTGLVAAVLRADSLQVIHQWTAVDGITLDGGEVSSKAGRLTYRQDDLAVTLYQGDLLVTPSPADARYRADVVVQRDYGYMRLLDTTITSVVPSIYLDYWRYMGDGSAQPDGHATNSLPAGNHTLEIHLGSRVGQYGGVYYKLDGLVDQWAPLPSDGVIDRFTVGPGDYSLQVRDDYDQRTLWQLSVRAPWYKTAWLLLVIVTVLGILFLLTRWYSMSKLSRQRSKLEAERRQALQEVAIKAKQEQLEAEVQHKARLLANSALTLAQKNKMLQDLRNKILLSARENGEPISQSQVIRLIDRNIDSDEGWRIFDQNFDEVHAAFLEKLSRRYDDLTASEVRLASFIRMGLASKEIAPLLNISVRSVENKRYRLRKKMHIDPGQNLSDTIRRL